MLKIGLIREEKIPTDNRVTFTPSQCKWIHNHFPGIRIIIQTSSHRSFSDKEYLMAGVEVREDISECNIMMGIKEVPADKLIADKIYYFFSHTKKLQPRNQKLFQAIIK